MSRLSKEDVVRAVREQNVHFIRMQFTDIFGQLKNVGRDPSACRRRGRGSERNSSKAFAKAAPGC